MKAFNLYQQISSSALRVEWDDLVEEICSKKGWLDDKSDKQTVVRGQTWDTLVQCKYTHLLTVCNNDASKRWYTHHTSTIKKPHRLTIKPFWKFEICH